MTVIGVAKTTPTVPNRIPNITADNIVKTGGHSHCPALHKGLQKGLLDLLQSEEKQRDVQRLFGPNGEGHQHGQQAACNCI